MLVYSFLLTTLLLSLRWKNGTVFYIVWIILDSYNLLNFVFLQSSCRLTTLPRSTLLLPLSLSALQITGNLCLSDFPWLRSADVLPFCGSLGMLWAEWAGQDQFIYHAGYVTGCDWAQMIIIVAGKAHPVVAFQHRDTHTHTGQSQQ